LNIGNQLIWKCLWINGLNVPKSKLAFAICHLKLFDEPLNNVPNDPVGPVLFIISPLEIVSNTKGDVLYGEPAECADDDMNDDVADVNVSPTTLVTSNEGPPLLK
jgi:hypothetical protein